MGRYIHDQNKVAFLHESGTYASPSGTQGVWIGQVTENSIDDAENKIEGRFLGTSTRSYSTMDQGPRDVTGTLTLNPQAMILPFVAIGSVTVVSGPTYTVNATEIQTDVRQSAFTSGTLCPLRSFTIEDSKQATGVGANFVRTINGVVPNSTTITATQGEKVTVSSDYVGQTLTFTSGTTLPLTEDTTTPYLWSSVSVTIDDEVIETTKEASLEINQNIEPPHYLNGSRDIGVPFPGNRENTFNLTIDLSSADGKKLYEDLYKNNTEFNAIFDMNQDNATGSQHAIYTMSGCRVTTMDNPSLNEGVTESTVEIMAETVTGKEYLPRAGALNFNPWE